MSNTELFRLAASSILDKHRREAVTRLLWVADENTDIDETYQCLAQLNSCDTYSVSNRIDIRDALESVSAASLSDFDITTLSSQPFSNCVYRVSKERKLVHYVLFCAANGLEQGGELLLFGKKNEGIKTYFDLCRKKLGFEGSIKKHGENYLCELQKVAAPTETESKLKAYTEVKHFEFGGQGFYSKPGVYGWNKQDQGSAFLIEQLETLAPELGNVESILDLGCGYGYLSVFATKLLKPKTLWATDNNITAVTQCKANLQKLLDNTGNNDSPVDFKTSDFKASTDDCAKSVQGAFDLILCNPPFHQGFSNDFNLTEKFIRSAKNKLSKDGTALFVFNAFVPAEKIAQRLFTKVCLLANNKQFKVYLFANKT